MPVWNLRSRERARYSLLEDGCANTGWSRLPEVNEMTEANGGNGETSAWGYPLCTGSPIIGFCEGGEGKEMVESL